jgi:putative transposase
MAPRWDGCPHWRQADLSLAGVDAEGEILDVLLQAKRDTKAARKLMRKLLKRQGMMPDEWITDKNPAYEAALRILKLT